MTTIQFLVPVADRKGRPYGRATMRRMELELERRFGGWSLVSREPLPGAWRNPSTQQIESDESWRYEVTWTSVEAVEGYLVRLGRRLGQAAMYMVVVGEGRIVDCRRQSHG